MITAIEVGNFKAIGERVRVELKPSAPARQLASLDLR